MRLTDKQRQALTRMAACRADDVPNSWMQAAFSRTTLISLVTRGLARERINKITFVTTWSLTDAGRAALKEDRP